MTTAQTAPPEGFRSPPLRTWQRRALSAYLLRRPGDFLAVATPGAGKTAFALRVAAELLAERTVAAVTVVTPTEHLKTQWAVAAAGLGIALDPTFRNADGATARDFRGAVVTYAQVAAAPALHRARTAARRTLVVLDEVHHAGDALSWGDAVREAFTPAARRLALTGTPFRSDENGIPFVRYEPEPGGALRSVADHAYGYGEALRDGVVRPVIFLAYSGEARWRTRAGEELSARLGEPGAAEHVARAWRTALDPAGDWVPAVLAAADTRLAQVRAGGMPDAAGLVIASDQAAARAYAGRLREITGERPVLVLSDDRGSSARISEFAASSARWMVAVRMVSEGVDVPRLAVGVYATSASTPLFFAQAVGRFVRTRRAGETASVFLPSVPPLLRLAGELEAVRDHVLGRSSSSEDGDGGWDDDLLAAAQARRDEPGEDERAFVSLGASAHLDQVIFDGASFGTGATPGTAEEEEYLGLPGLLEPEQVALLLRQRQARQVAEERRRGRSTSPAAGPPRAGDQLGAGQLGAGQLGPGQLGPGQVGPAGPAGAVPAHERRAALRRQLNALVAAQHHRTGRPHGTIHAELRRACGGPPTAVASVAELEQRIATLQSW
ncbi:MAG TPA: DEAD/DEAH box helicase [Mycobacteriales bacterium]|nr:DEAD/DEAH box helicase [Mycobacteriales bacterium]